MLRRATTIRDSYRGEPPVASKAVGRERRGITNVKRVSEQTCGKHTFVTNETDETDETARHESGIGVLAEAFRFPLSFPSRASLFLFLSSRYDS